MKKTINIFVAGAKDLKNERNALKALAHELNTSYEDRKININLKIRSYEDFRDNQIEYNNFIENEADVAIFVLKDRIGKHTEEEFINAASAFNRKKIPEIIVFLNKDREETPEVAHIQELLQEHLGNHYFVEYSDDDDLKAKARKRLDRLIRPTFRMNSRATIWVLALTTLCACIFAGLFAWNSFFKEGKPKLLFAGGGSVINYIQDVQGNNRYLIDYPNSVCAYMSSSLAWKLLAEEVNRYDYQNKNLNYRTICLSADSIPCDSNSIQNVIGSCSVDDIIEKARVIECYLNEDSLVVYIDNRFFDEQKKFLDDYEKLHHTKIDRKIPNTRFGKISINLLNEIMHNKDSLNTFFFSTSATSGTAIVYQKELDKINSSINFKNLFDSNQIKVYTEQIDKTNLNKKSGNKKWFVLGSQHYHFKFPTGLDADEQFYSKYYVVNNEGKHVSKPMYIYFVAFKRNDIVTIPEDIFDFLSKIHPNGNSNWNEQLKKCKKEGLTISQDASVKATLSNGNGFIIPFIKPKTSKK